MECTLENLNLEYAEVKASLSQKLLYFKVFFKRILNWRGLNKISMENTLAHSKKIREKAKEGTNGWMVKFLKANGNKAKRMDMEFGSHQTGIAMLATGWMDGNMEKEPIHIKTAYTRDNLLIVWNTDTVNNLLQTEIILKATTSMVSLKVREDMNGSMGVITRDNSRAVIETGKENWNKLMVPLTKVLCGLP